MKIFECEQNSPEWYAARCGIPTASSFDKIITTKGEPSKQKQKYLYQLAGERITRSPEESYQNAAMQRGKELENEARLLYGIISGVEALPVGFCLAEGYGASPDGLVAGTGLLELKCPLLATHVGYLLDNALPTDYFQQVQGQLLVTGRVWCDFMSYYPGIKPLLIRVQRDEKFIRALKIELEVFVSELETLTERLK
jgi:putative phage-type endonuclease